MDKESSADGSKPLIKITDGQLVVTSATDTGAEEKPFLERLGEQERRHLMEHLPREHHAPGTVLFREGELGEALYVIESGRVAILKEEKDATFTLLAYRGAGDIVGEMGVLGHRPRAASVVTTGPTELIRITEEAFRELVLEHPALDMAILDVLSDRLRSADLARTAMAQESIALARKVETLTSEAERLMVASQVEKDTVDLIVHDLRAPLGVIKTSLLLLETTIREKERPEEEHLVDIALRNTDRLLSMVESMLEAAQQERTRIPLVREPTDLAALIETAVETARLTAIQNDIQLEFEPPSEHAVVWLDANKIQRVLLNLLDNAMTYTPDGGLVRVSMSATEGETTVRVTDTGPGVPQEHRERIFKRFGQVPNAQGRKRGFGLGLYFCRQVVEAHGGRIWMEPGPEGTGSCFSFTLPVAEP
jgi:signal transduction histidine kinase